MAALPRKEGVVKNHVNCERFVLLCKLCFVVCVRKGGREGQGERERERERESRVLKGISLLRGEVYTYRSEAAVISQNEIRLI
jgi:hypothetical protein